MKVFRRMILLIMTFIIATAGCMALAEEETQMEIPITDIQGIRIGQTENAESAYGYPSAADMK